MFLIVIVGILLIVVTVVLQGFGTMYLIKRFDRYHNDVTHHNFQGKSLNLVVTATLFLIVVHLFQAAFWAVAYMLLPEITEFKTFEESYYFSLVTFTTLGYGDLIIASENRILAGLEAISGIILLGWSTAFMIAVFRELMKGSLKKN